MLGGGDTLAELTVRDLAAYGVPRDALVSSPASTGNTREEAQALADLVVKRGWRRILVVTSNYHTRRARYIFQRVFPPDVKVRILAAPETDYDPDRWWKTRQGRRVFFRETLAYCRAIWELRVIASSVVPTTTVSVGREP